MKFEKRLKSEEALEEAEALKSKIGKDKESHTGEEYREGYLDLQAEKEKEVRPERLERLEKEVERLFPGEKLKLLRNQIRESLSVPQFGPHHNEGMFMDAHLDIILHNLKQISQGNFPEGSPEEVSESFRETAKDNFEMLERYTFLHDLAKRDRLRIKWEGRKAEDISWVDWQKLIPKEAVSDPVALRAFCKKAGINGISYFQPSKLKEGVQHGNAAVRMLERNRDLRLPRHILTAIDKHEIAYQFESAKPKTYETHLGGLSQKERDLALLASFLDTSASYKAKTHSPDFSNFKALLESKRQFEAGEARSI